MQYPADCAVVLVFDTSKGMTEHLKEKPKLMRTAKHFYRKGRCTAHEL
jgi:hypothetical protein